MPVTTESLEQMISETKYLVEQKNFNAVVSKLIVLQPNMPSLPLQSEIGSIIAAVAVEAQKEAGKGEADTESLILRLENLRLNLLKFAKEGTKARVITRKSGEKVA